MTVKAQKPIVIFRGDNTAAFDLRTITILLTGDLDLSQATAKFTLLDFSKTWTEQEVATGELSIVFTAEQTKAFALGPQTGTLRLYDMSTGMPRQLTIVNKIPFFVTNRVCDIENQNYEADVCVTSGEVIHVEFNVGLIAIAGKADKVRNATAGDLASLTVDGNLEDSGIPKTDVLRKTQMDATPTAGSQNPVTSDGIKQAIEAAKPADYEQVKQQVQTNANSIAAINSKIPSGASSSNHLVTLQELQAATPSDYDQVKAQVATNTQNISRNAGNIADNTNDISGIKAKIPAQASAQNQLADKAFVNSSIATNTATFRGTYNLVSALGLSVAQKDSYSTVGAALKTYLDAHSVTQENNDYCFVQVPKTDAEPTVIERVDRYKCTVTESGGVTTRVWEYEWSLNNSSFTADQWAAINSGITSGLVEKLNGIEAGAQVNTVTGVKGNAEQDYRTGNINLTPANIGAATSAQGTKADTAYQKPAGGIPKTDLSSGVQSSLGKADTALQSVKVNGTALTPDADKAVDVTVPQASDTAPIVAGAATAGSSGAFSRGDHVHPTDTSRAPIESPAFTGTPTAPTPTAGDNSTKVATTEFVHGALPYAIASVPSGDALTDRTVNTKTVNAATYAPSFPEETSGKSCDFYLAITSDTAGTVSAPSGKTLYNAKGESANLDYEANKTAVLRFTQIGANTYVVTGGANGGGSVDPAQLATKLDSTSAAPAFSDDSSVSYAVGAHVTYNGKLYSCTTATTGGTWVAGSWTADTMTDPDAVLDITAQNQLRVVAKDGTLLWAQGYNLASTSSATLACDAVNNFTFADGATTQAFALPTAPTGKVGDFILDIDNSANTGAATMVLTGLDTAFSVVVPKDESLTNMLVITVGELARFYITLTTFRINNLPTWHIVKQVVENGGATV